MTKPLRPDGTIEKRNRLLLIFRAGDHVVSRELKPSWKPEPEAVQSFMPWEDRDPKEAVLQAVSSGVIEQMREFVPSMLRELFTLVENDKKRNDDPLAIASWLEAQALDAREKAAKSGPGEKTWFEVSAEAYERAAKHVRGHR
jgi:hypothetical protein